jgi:hypothetical protein
MVLPHPPLWRQIAEHVSLLIIGSSHGSVLPCADAQSQDFFSSLLEGIPQIPTILPPPGRLVTYLANLTFPSAGSTKRHL